MLPRLVALLFHLGLLVIQTFVKIPALHAVAPGNPPSGPLFGAVQGAVLVAFGIAGWMSLRRFRPVIV